ncbi:MAG: FAD-dependent oxidoreductase [Phormidesmis sp.]
MAQKVAVCPVEALKEGEMRQFSVADEEVLLARFEDEFWAITPKCPHAGAALADGVMKDGRVICPWHNACFSLRSGAMIEPPALNDLAQYPTSIESGTVYVELPSSKDSDTAGNKVPELANQGSDDRTFVIIGGGAAGCAAAQMLRQVKFEGRIVLVTASEEPPYDRTKLSKAYLQQDRAEDPDLLRPISFYRRYDITLKTAAKVTKLDAKTQTITYGSGETIQYDVLLIATGGAVKKIPIDGSDLGNVFTLRQAQDARAILRASKQAKKVVIVGSGFIGMEVASSLNQQGLDITIVTPDEIPFENVLGEQVGKLMMRVHESHGVKFRLESKATAFKGDGKVSSVELENGDVLPADMVVVGIGVQPATDFIEGLALDKDDKSIPVNQYLQAAPNVYAAGDIAQFPHFITGESVRIEHWRLAMQHGRTAARNMMGEAVAFESVPFFWTGQYDFKLRYIGHAEKWDDIVIQGSLEEKSFLAFYVKDEQVLAVAGMGRDKEIAAISELMNSKQMPDASKLQTENIDWVEQMQLK